MIAGVELTLPVSAVLPGMSAWEQSLLSLGAGGAAPSLRCTEISFLLRNYFQLHAGRVKLQMKVKYLWHSN